MSRTTVDLELTMTARIPLLLGLLLGVALARGASAQVVVDVSAITNDPAHPVAVHLGAGTWRATPIDPSTGGAFTAWHPWNGTNIGCGSAPGSCSQGWLWSYFMQCPGRPPLHVRHVVTGAGLPKYATAQEAFALGSVAAWMPIPGPVDLTLWIGDSVYIDNLGGVSIRFEQVTPAVPGFVADTPSISVARGGAQRLTVDGGPGRAGNFYFVLGSASGTSPGLMFGCWNLPLNAPDPYLEMTASLPNTAVHVATFGRLDALGRAGPRIDLPGPQPPAIAGLSLHHAVVTFDGSQISGISAPLGLDIVR